jgi:hypothetical protein
MQLKKSLSRVPYKLLLHWSTTINIDYAKSSEYIVKCTNKQSPHFAQFSANERNTFTRIMHSAAAFPTALSVRIYLICNPKHKVNSPVTQRLVNHVINQDNLSLNQVAEEGSVKSTVIEYSPCHHLVTAGLC